jgi:hypothetical protein
MNGIHPTFVGRRRCHEVQEDEVIIKRDYRVVNRHRTKRHILSE